MMIEEESRALWEPWTPSVGQRVRTRISAECIMVPMESSPQWRHGVFKGHEDWEDGLIGTVIDWRWRENSQRFVDQGHPHTVKYDVPQRREGVLIHGSMYASTELEPMEDTEGIV